jgi:hypothetical protein
MGRELAVMMTAAVSVHCRQLLVDALRRQESML